MASVTARSDRLLAAGVLAPDQTVVLTVYRDRLNATVIARRIPSIQEQTTALVRDTTLALRAAADEPVHDTAHGVTRRRLTAFAGNPTRGTENTSQTW